MRDKARSAKHPEAETVLVPPKQNRWLNVLLATTALVSAFAIAIPSSAAEFQWEGGTSDDWSDGSNWIGGNAPGANDHVVIDTNIPNFPVIDATNVELTYTGADLNRPALVIGATGVGHLTISNGAELVQGGNAYIGRGASSNGVVLVSTESNWTIDGRLRVGSFGEGRLEISGGSVVSNTFSGIGDGGPNGDGEIHVSGSGSLLQNDTTITIGASGGSARLIIDDQGRVENTNGIIGGSGGKGIATVSGSGTVWENTGNLFIGQTGTGEGHLIAENGGRVSANEVVIANFWRYHRSTKHWCGGR